MKKLLGKLSQRKIKPDQRGASEDEASTGAPAQDVSASVTSNGAVKAVEQPSSSSIDAPVDPLANTPFKRVRYLKNEGLGQALLVAHDKDNHPVVIKLLDRGANVSSKVEEEVVNHHKCKGHPNIVELIDMFLTPKHLAFVMEVVIKREAGVVRCTTNHINTPPTQYAEGGDLKTHIARAGKLSEAEARTILRQVVRALQRYHAVGMAKRDLRLEHVLLCSGGSAGSPCIKLCDFAYSKTEQVNSDPKSALGSLVYTAPEEITVQNHTDDRAADVWSCGVLLYIMLTGTYPFGQLAEVYDQKQVQEMLSRIMEAKFVVPTDVSSGASALLRQMLVKEVQQRISLQDVCADAWFAQDVPEGFWEDVPPVPDSRDLQGEEAELRALCHAGQRALVSTPSADIDQLADDLMDMEECEAAFDDLDLHDGIC